MKWTIYLSVFLAITLNVSLALSQSVGPDSSTGTDRTLSYSSYCQGIPDEVLSHCAKVLSDNMTRLLRTIAQGGQSEEVRVAAGGLLGLPSHVAYERRPPDSFVMVSSGAFFVTIGQAVLAAVIADRLKDVSLEDTERILVAIYNKLKNEGPDCFDTYRLCLTLGPRGCERNLGFCLLSLLSTD